MIGIDRWIDNGEISSKLLLFHVLDSRKKDINLDIAYGSFAFENCLHFYVFDMLL